MLSWARGQRGKPFSASGMARSLVWPRTTDGSSWYCAELSNPSLHKYTSLHQLQPSTGTFWCFRDHRYCAELVAACLQIGGLMSPESKPGAATPQSLYRLYKNSGAVAANPCALRREFGGGGGGATVGPLRPHTFNIVPRPATMTSSGEVSVKFANRPPPAPSRGRALTPPRMAFRVMSSGHGSQAASHGGNGSLSLSLASLSMRGSD